MRGIFWISVLCAASFGACSSSSTHPAATGGAAGTGGSTGGSAGAGATGGSTGGSAGAAGTPSGGGTGAVSGTGGGDAGLSCPTLEGAKLVPAFGYCIDETEVTNEQYLKFVDAVSDAGTANQPSACSTNTSFAPDTTSVGCPTNPSGDAKDLPIRCVDWCDAHAYCAWAGKRLCGSRVTSGGIATSAYADAKVSQWYAACTGDGVDLFPYGKNYDTAACVEAADSLSSPLSVKSKPGTCVGYPVIAFDLSGNVAEWEDGCSGDSCLIRGGSFNDSNPAVSCAGNPGGDFHPRLQSDPSIGFRCCWSP